MCIRRVPNQLAESQSGRKSPVDDLLTELIVIDRQLFRPRHMDISDAHPLERLRARLDQLYPLAQFRVGLPAGIAIIKRSKQFCKKQPTILPS